MWMVFPETLRERERRPAANRSSRIVPLSTKVSAAVVVLLAIVFTAVLVRLSTSQSVDNRVSRELEGVSWLQATTLRTHLEDQFEPLWTASNMLANGETFASASMRPALRGIMQTHELRMFSFADLEGNITNYEGEPVGNIRDRRYFYDIVNGTDTKVCEYLATTKFTNETRMIFSAPAYDASGKLLGVLFIGKEIDVLERALFKDDDMFGVASSYFICDGEGKVLAATRDMYRNGLISDSADSIFEKMPALAGMNCENGKCKSVMVNEKKYYAAMISLQVNDWHLQRLLCGYCIHLPSFAADPRTRSARNTYHPELQRELQPIQWDVDSLDWKDYDADTICQRVTSNVQPGSIVLFHNAALHTPEALPAILTYLINDGYTILPISQLILHPPYTIDHTGRQFPAEELS